MNTKILPRLLTLLIVAFSASAQDFSSEAIMLPSGGGNGDAGEGNNYKLCVTYPDNQTPTCILFSSINVKEKVETLLRDSFTPGYIEDSVTLEHLQN